MQDRKGLTSKYLAYITLAGVSILACVVTGRLEFVLVGLPFVVALGLRVLERMEPDYSVELEPVRSRWFEGETAIVRARVSTRTHLPLLEVNHVVLHGADEPRTAERIVVSMNTGDVRDLTFEMALPSRGAYILGQLECRVLSGAGLVWSGYRSVPGTQIFVYPEVREVRFSRGSARRTRLYNGDYTSRTPGEGIDLSGVREYASGDATRQVNWRVSSRWASLFVNERLQERNMDVVILVDSLRDVGPAAYTALDSAARAAASIALHYLKRKDRVGFIEYGGTMAWTTPQAGKRQFYVILERLARMRVFESYAFREIGAIPKRVLPPGALVIAFTPLLDSRSVQMLQDLAARGFDPVVVYVSAVTHAESLIGLSPAEQVAKRWWAMEQRAKIVGLLRVGLSVVEWDGAGPIDSCLGPLLSRGTQRVQQVGF
ncbi:MAG: DUF58 domain-containing protein [Firmicutes bacterium]|nr:DUF58 domain-containing protein [Bacillota bacterium]